MTREQKRIAELERALTDVMNHLTGALSKSAMKALNRAEKLLDNPIGSELEVKPEQRAPTRF